MKTLLRHASTGKYFQCLDKWTSDRENAHDFGIARRALKFAQKLHVPNLELVLSLDEPQKLQTTPFGEFLRTAMRNTRARTRRLGLRRGTSLRLPRLTAARAF
jgi:hypothetical protein